MTWLVCDYGGVLGHHQPPSDQARLVALSRLDGNEFWARYWWYRPAYDRGDVTALAYWAGVLGAAPSAPQLNALVRADVTSWSHPDRAAVAAARRSRARGFRLALLSNAPVEVARGIQQLPWLRAFEPRLFSCDLGSIKPEPKIYHAMLRALGVTAGEVVFLDDRPENAAAAALLGIEAHTFTGATQFDELRSI